jgi:transcriptional pleiotropic regulator of transition state genes
MRRSIKMPKGIVRKMEGNGRISIPIECRKAISAKEREGFELHIVGNVIRLKKGSGRRLDEVGRYTIPSAVRESLKIGDRELLDIYIEDNEICLRKETFQCVFCGEDDEDKLIKRNGLFACEKCIEELSDFLDRSRYQKVMEA